MALSIGIYSGGEAVGALIAAAAFFYLSSRDGKAAKKIIDILE